MAQGRKILDGPSKYDLDRAIMDGKRVIFKVYGLVDAECQVNAVEAEDGSRESWNIKGFRVYRGECHNFQGYYSTRTRSGVIEIQFS